MSNYSFICMDFNYWLIKIGISVAIFIVAKIIHWFINHSIHRVDTYAEKKGLSALDISDSSKKAISQFSKYIIYGIAFLGVLYVFELNDILMGILTAAGVSGIAIGFAAKDLISNSLSGLILIFDRPFSLGDSVEIGRFIDKGTVESIGIRNTTLKLRDGKIVTVPNSQVLSEHVINHSRTAVRLVELIVEVDIDSNVKKALKLVDELLDSIEWKSEHNPSEVFIADVNKDNVILRIKVWIDSVRYGERKTELFYQIRDLLKKNRIKSSVIREDDGS